MSHKKYHIIGLGGTFDHFHAGHRSLLDTAANLGDELHIGIADGNLTQHKMLTEGIESFKTREQNVQKYLRQKNIVGQTFPLQDRFGPTLTPHTKIQALAVSTETQAGGERINEERLKKGLPTLPMFVVPMLKDENGEEISSTKIRQGMIDREGHVFANLFRKDIVLTPKQRTFFQQKQGKIVTTPNDEYLPHYVVGDIVLETFLQKKWPFNLGIYDGKNLRNQYSSKSLQTLQPIKVVKNAAGSISTKMVEIIKNSLQNHNRTILVDGEEDLAAVALALVAPLGSAIYYGQHKEGIVEMVVTETLKKTLSRILQMTEKNECCTFYVVRHGESAANVAGPMNFAKNPALTPKGEAQALARAKSFQGIRFDRAFSSDFIRAQRTAEIIALEHQLELTTTEILREKNFGILEGKKHEEFSREIHELMQKYDRMSYEERKDLRLIEGMETDSELVTRLLTFLRETALAYPGETILVVAHGAIMRALLIHLGFATTQTLPPQSIENTGYFQLRSDGIDFFVEKTEGVSVREVGST